MNIKIDSRKVIKGDTFIALRGINNDGHKYVIDAIKNGASTVIVEEGEYNVNTIVVKDTKEYLKEYLENNYYDEIKKLKLIGMTGTNGKTTTCFLLYQALNKINKKCAYIGTLGFYLTDEKRMLTNTTPSLYELYEMLLECVQNNYEYVVMEVSSQGISMGRVDTLVFDYVIFSNLTQDHLDYHGTIDNYVLEKQKLFKMTNNSFAIINSDDKYKDYFILDNKNITYGKTSNDYKISDINCTIKGSSFRLNDEEYFTKLIGEYNIYNITVVIILLKLLEVEKIKEVIENLDSPNGRMDIINYKDNVIIIDYAHTPDAVEKIITNVSKLPHNKVITLIGCGGNRDRSKRSIMGDIATKYSDYVIFTSDNPRYEKPKKILKDITCKLDIKNYKIIENREKAIKKSIQMLSKNDILLLLGKGHEDYQIIRDKKIPFSDKEKVMKYLR
ncbi:MAG: UDP-N-acetylmuramoyl-L-alanyl-D-glutamate--2,6-diaminopimelate ligase [Firmicutes bacterium]|nr:UDP-N-acetylmuramoyl-L-alanyl-D-glutamate--2,6-diaminopimelate ligase [Bacillota bacterium]